MEQNPVWESKLQFFLATENISGSTVGDLALKLFILGNIKTIVFIRTVCARDRGFNKNRFFKKLEHIVNEIFFVLFIKRFILPACV